VSSVGDFRRSLMASLAAALEVEFVAGPVEKAQGNRDLGCVWLEGKRPLAGDGNMEEVVYGVRLFRAWQQGQGATESGRNVAMLEDDVELLQAAFKAVLTTAGHDFFQVAAITPNYELQYVEAALTAFQRNLGAKGG